MPPKLFTQAEANRLLPRLEPLVLALRATVRRLRAQQASLDAAREAARGNGHGLAGEELARVKAEVERLAAEARERARALEGLGVVLKDVELGLVDFLAQRGEEQVFLCWKVGEPRVAFWHGLHEGYRGRKPIGDQFG
jgi:hypothetical protein